MTKTISSLRQFKELDLAGVRSSCPRRRSHRRRCPWARHHGDVAVAVEQVDKPLPVPGADDLQRVARPFQRPPWQAPPDIEDGGRPRSSTHRLGAGSHGQEMAVQAMENLFIWDYLQQDSETQRGRKPTCWRAAARRRSPLARQATASRAECLQRRSPVSRRRLDHRQGAGRPRLPCFPGAYCSTSIVGPVPTHRWPLAGLLMLLAIHGSVAARSFVPIDPPAMSAAGRAGRRWDLPAAMLRNRPT